MPDNRSISAPAPAATGTIGTESTFALLERARTGDPAALDQLMARHLAPLRRWTSGRLPKWAREITDTDDLVQDALLQTVKRLDVFEPKGPGALLAYLRQSVLNRVRDELRKKARRPDATVLDGLDIDAGGASPLEEAMGRQEFERYEQALAALTPIDREAVIGRVEMGYSYEELAEALGKPSAEAARKAARRALLRLVQHIDPGT